MEGTSRLGETLRVRAGEGRLVSMVLAYGFCLGLGRMFSGAAVSGLFLDLFGARALPYAFIGTALLVPLTGLAYLRLQRSVPLARLIALVLGLLVLVLLAFRVALGISQAPWLVMTLMIGYTTVYVLVSLSFWGLVNQLFDVRQGKRLYGLLSAGSETADISGGLLTLALAPVIGAPNLLLLAGAGMLAALLFEQMIVRRHRLAADRAEGEGEPAPALGAILSSGYVRLLLALVALSQLGYFLVENVFYDLSMAHFHGPGQFSALVGATVAASSVLTILLQVTVAGPLLGRFGLRLGLPLLPALLLIGAAAVSVAGGLAGPVFAVFVLMLATRVGERALRFSIDETAVQIAYQPLPAMHRSLLQTVVDGGVKPLAGGVAGVLILLCTGLLGFGGVELATLLAAVAVAWLVVAARLGRGYRAALLNALGRRRLSGASLRVDDGESLAMVQRGLRSHHAGEAIYALQLLEELEHASLPTAHVTLLAHPEPAVRWEALQRIARAGVAEQRAPVSALLAREADPAVRGQALRTLAALGGATPELLASALAELEPEVRLGAAVALDYTQGRPTLLTWLRAHAHADSPRERTLAARVFGELGVPDEVELLESLLRDESIGVRRAALLAVPNVGVDALWPEVVRALGSSSLRSAATTSLTAGGSGALSALGDTLRDEAAPMPLRIQAARAAGKLGATAGELLVAQLHTPAEEFRHALAAALDQCGYQAAGPTAERIWDAIQAETSEAAWALAAQRDFGNTPVYAFLHAALARGVLRSRERILNLLGALLDPDTLRRVRTELARGADQQAYAVEALDLLLPATYRALVLPLVERLGPAETLVTLERSFPQAKRTAEQRLAEILDAPPGRRHPWIRLCAQKVVRGPGEAGSDALELILFERVQLLKGSNIFQAVAEEDLLAVASLLRPVRFATGATVFARGDAGSCAYLIASGNVRVHDGERVLSELGAGELLGELAVLDSRPRSLSATALEPAELLRLDREPLFELMADHIAVARGIMAVLIRNLRANVRELGALQLVLQAATASTTRLSTELAGQRTATMEGGMITP